MLLPNNHTHKKHWTYLRSGNVTPVVKRAFSSDFEFYPKNGIWYSQVLCMILKDAGVMYHSCSGFRISKPDTTVSNQVLSDRFSWLPTSLVSPESLSISRRIDSQNGFWSMMENQVPRVITTPLNEDGARTWLITRKSYRRFMEATKKTKGSFHIKIWLGNWFLTSVH